MGKTREKPQVMVIRDAAHASEVLRDIAWHKRSVDEAWAKANTQIDRVKSDTTASTAMLCERITDLEAALTSWAEHNREAILPRGKKSLKLVHGIIGWRESSKLATLKGWTWARVLGVLGGLGKTEAIRKREEPDKEVLATWSEDALNAVGVYTKKEDTFFYELDEAGEADKAEVA